VELSERDLAHLLEMVRGAGESDEAKVIQSITPTSKKDVYRVSPGGFVGRIGLPSGETIDIESRFDLHDVVDLIRFSGRLPIRLDRLAPAMDQEVFLLDVIAFAFAREVDRLVSFGLAKGYRRYRFDRPPYPGRPDVTYHLSRYAARPDKLVTSARRITIDIDLNRALAAALDVLSRVPLTRDPARALSSLSSAFGRVKHVPTSAESLARFGLDRLTVRYREALALAAVILRGQSLTPKGEIYGGASVLFNLPKVWEACVAKWVQQEWGPDYDVTEQFTFDVTIGGELRSEADVTVWRDGTLVGLYDAKYKWPGDKPKMGDVYQMVTYCTKLGIDTSTLVYPVQADQKSYRVGDVTVHTLGLDVGSLMEVSSDLALAV